MPPDMDFEVAAAITLTYGTSHHAIVDRGGLQSGETMLVLGAAGGVGLAAIEIGKAIGARVIATASTAEKLAIAAANGADRTVLLPSPDALDQLRAAMPNGADVVFDPVGGDAFDLSLRCTGNEGRILVIGFAAGRI